jgi:hypothetical protein
MIILLLPLLDTIVRKQTQITLKRKTKYTTLSLQSKIQSKNRREGKIDTPNMHITFIA